MPAPLRRGARPSYAAGFSAPRGGVGCGQDPARFTATPAVSGDTIAPLRRHCAPVHGPAVVEDDMPTLTCPVCAAEVQQDDLICFTCGANLPRGTSQDDEQATPPTVMQA